MGAVYTTTFNLNCEALQYVKETDLTRATPSDAVIAVDENADSLQDGYLESDSMSGGFPDVPALRRTLAICAGPGLLAMERPTCGCCCAPGATPRPGYWPRGHPG
jgi:hypothetical protein